VKLFTRIVVAEIVLVLIRLNTPVGAEIYCAPIVLVVKLQEVTLLTNAAADPAGNPNVFNTPYPPFTAVFNVT
jgi:hypothetical protein